MLFIKISKQRYFCVWYFDGKSMIGDKNGQQANVCKGTVMLYMLELAPQGQESWMNDQENSLGMRRFIGGLDSLQKSVMVVTTALQILYLDSQLQEAGEYHETSQVTEQ